MDGDVDGLAPVRLRGADEAVTPREPRRSVQWTVRTLFAIPLVALAAFAVWAVVLSAGALAHTLGVIAVLILLGGAWAKMRGDTPQ